MEQQLRKRPSSRETSKSSKPGSRDGSSDAAAGNGVIGYLFGSWGGAADGSGNGTGNEARNGANVREHEMVPYSATGTLQQKMPYILPRVFLLIIRTSSKIFEKPKGSRRFSNWSGLRTKNVASAQKD